MSDIVNTGLLPYGNAASIRIESFSINMRDFRKFQYFRFVIRV